MSTFRQSSEILNVSHMTRQKRIPAFERDWQDARKILCVRLDSLGDVLMCSPAIRALKEGKNEREITLLTSTAGRGIAALIPEVEKVIAYDAPWMKATAPRRDSQPEYAMADRLRGEAFDGVVIFTAFSQSPLPAALLSFLADIPLRTAYCRENPYQLLTHGLPELDHTEDEDIRHEVRRQLDLVAALGCRATDERLSLRVSAQARHFVSKILSGMGLDLSRPWAVIHPGTPARSRQYAPEGYADVGRILALEHGIQLVFTGIQSEIGLVKLIQHEMKIPSHSLAGKLDLEQLAALISLAPVLISNNTGPVHMAAAVGTPIVDLYALTNPQQAPWMVPHRLLYEDVPCKFCFKSACPMGHHDCLSKVPAQRVVESALELLSISNFSSVEERQNI